MRKATNWRWKTKKKKQVNIVKAGWLMKTKYIPIKKLIKKLDIVFSKYKRLSNLTPQGYIRCFTCGGFFTYRQTDCGHYIGRECLATRYLEENTAPQCHDCNRWAEGKKSIFAINLQKKYGKDILDKLHAKENEIWQPTAYELETLILFYKQKTLELLAGESNNKERNDR